jgi:prepilin-type N-terminal cleavage/methylation domain-containing protein
MRRGVTLVELVLVLALVGILFGMTVPALSLLLDSLAVHEAVSHIGAAHARARLLAIARGQVITLAIDSARIAISPRNDTIPLWSEEGPSAQRVHLEGAQRQFTFSPEGFTLGVSNASLQLSRGATRQTVVISRLGRVRVLP